MKKLVKGSLAGAAGVVLLLGGAGTFAYWNSTADIAGGDITAGQLTLTNDGAPGAWTDQDGDPVDLATYRIVPGDTLEYTDDLSLTAVGTNLEAQLSLAGGAITPATPGDAEDIALAGYLNSTAVLSLTAAGTGADPATITPAGPANTYDVTPGTATVTVTVTFTFPVGTLGSNNDAQLGVVDLSNMAIQLVQTFTP